MIFFEYLTRSREKVQLSQKKAAELIGVSLALLQGWERDSLPNNAYKELIIDTYKLDEGEYTTLYSNTFNQINKKNNCKFPSFLFSEIESEKIKNLSLSPQEQELLGLETLYNNTYRAFNDSMHAQQNYSFDICSKSILSNLPYDYVKRVGSFEVFKIHKQLCEKLGEHKDNVIEYLKKNPDKTFDISKLSSKEIYEIFRPSHIEDVIPVLEMIERASDQILPMYSFSPQNNRYFKVLFSDEDASILTKTIKNLLHYTSDFSSLHSYDDTFFRTEDLYNFHSFKSFFNEYFEYAEVESNNPAYIERKQKYGNVAWYGEIYLIMTLKGAELLEWCRKERVRKGFNRNRKFII